MNTMQKEMSYFLKTPQIISLNYMLVNLEFIFQTMYMHL